MHSRPVSERARALSGIGWARGALAAIVAFVGASTLAPSVANTLKRADPAMAHTLASWDGRLTAARAKQLFVGTSRADAGAPSSVLAREALMQDATAVDALTILAFQAQLRGEAAASDRYHSVINQLTRREMSTNIWAIEEAVGRGDIAAALYGYDLTLRISNDASQILFPTLASAVNEPAVRSRLLKTLTGRPPWLDPFLSFAAERGPYPLATRALFLAADEAGLKTSDAQWAALVTALLKGGYAAEAWEYFVTRRAGAQRTASRDDDFAALPLTRAPFDWQASNDPSLSAAIMRSERGGALEFEVANGGAGVIATQWQVLLPGTYRLEAVTSGISQQPRSQPYFTLTCSSGRDLGKIPVAQSASEDDKTTGTFLVPQGCAVQELSLVARPVDDMDGLAGKVHRISLRRNEP